MRWDIVNLCNEGKCAGCKWQGLYMCHKSWEKCDEGEAYEAKDGVEDNVDDEK